MNKGSLYLCATPIGNLEDMSFRSIRILKEVDLVAAEDTRHTKNLFSYYDIKTPLTSYHKFNLKSKIPILINKILEGSSIAVVSDAGMPGISDPGSELAAEAIKYDIRVVPIPGPTAFVSALAASGFSADKFVFYGFLPSKQSERRKILKESALEEKTLVFYEAPHRLCKTLIDMYAIYEDRRACVARELTKKHEEFFEGKLSEIIKHYSNNGVKGEITLIVAGADVNLKKELEIKEMVNKVERLINAGTAKKEAVKLVAEDFQIPKKILYAEVEKRIKKELPCNS